MTRGSWKSAALLAWLAPAVAAAQPATDPSEPAAKPTTAPAAVPRAATPSQDQPAAPPAPSSAASATPASDTAPAASATHEASVPSASATAATPEAHASEAPTSGAAPVQSEPAEPATAASEPEAGTAEIDSGPPEVFSGQLGSHQQHLFGWFGVRNDYVRDASFDMFATNDSLVAFGLGLGGVVFTQGNFSLAAMGFFERAAHEADARGDDTELRVYRLLAGPEARYHVFYWLYGFARAGLGADHVRAARNSEFYSEELVSKQWIFASEVSGGAAFELLGSPAGELRKPRLWLIGEGGYAFTTGAKLEFSPEDTSGSAPERTQSEASGELSLSAPMFRVAVTGTY